jgi:hypothetical protein
MARYIALYNDTMVAQKGSLLLKQNLGTRSANLTQGPRGGGSTVKPKTALVSQSCFCSDIYLDPLESCESDKIQPRGHHTCRFQNGLVLRPDRTSPQQG